MGFKWFLGSFYMVFRVKIHQNYRYKRARKYFPPDFLRLSYIKIMIKLPSNKYPPTMSLGDRKVGEFGIKYVDLREVHAQIFDFF